LYLQQQWRFAPEVTTAGLRPAYIRVTLTYEGYGMITTIRSRAVEVANTWKFRTVVFIILACFLPLWPITFPLFLYIAYKSYKSGTPELFVSDVQVPLQVIESPSQQSKATEITKLHNLMQQGALTQEEFDQEKRRVLNE